MVLDDNTIDWRRGIGSVLDFVWHAWLRLPSCGIGRHIDVVGMFAGNWFVCVSFSFIGVACYIPSHDR